MKTREERSGEADPLALLEVIDRLEVGPVSLEPRRLVMPYRVFRGDEKAEIELIFRYEADVFAPDDPADQNLAGLIGAQLALNYGLFCKEIRFFGRFDLNDQRFLTDMMENTSREIYIVKINAQNPFLLPPVRDIPQVVRKHYTRAKLVFDPPWRPQAAKPTGWEADPHRICVLSSGGKDSLLTYGLLEELGFEVHPIFGNESGRHWFTALNAYRYLDQKNPHNARVWMNTDRVFTFMLRQLPFIREDFARIRADIYPIRLWTVAIFAFAVFPEMKRRRIAHITIGNEFDATDRARWHGLTFYNGGYDQSRFFDHEMTRYFGRKHWRICQYSIIRPLSELLIEKILHERYPHLLEQQVSCHATHKEGERVRPCGRCEKCRRIQGMLSALGADPAICGYTPEQVSEALEQLPQSPLKQEPAAFAHLLYRLDQRGLVQLSPKQRAFAKAHPEIEKIRFDQECSQIQDIPVALRVPLYNIFLEHTAGAARRVGRIWQDVDLLTLPDLFAPYQHESSTDPRALRVPQMPAFSPLLEAPAMETPAQQEETPHSSAEPRAEEAESPFLASRQMYDDAYPFPLPPRPKRAYLLRELTWPEAQERFRETDIALLPVGAIEQHGPHLPLDVDAFDADTLARAVAARCPDPKPLVLPLMPYGVSYHHNDFSGTLSITNETMARLIYDIGLSVARNGITKLVIINGHGGNAATLDFAAQMINRDTRMFVAIDSGETSDVDIEGMTETAENDVHAGEIETSTTLAIRPHLVDMSKAVSSIPRFSSRYMSFTSSRGISWHAYTKRISENGVMGDPTKATAEKGRKIWEVMIHHLVAFVQELQSMTLDELYQRRY